MKRKNTKLLDSQRYSECQLVSAINAAVYLGEPLVDPSSEEYERLVDLVGARHGSALHIRDAVRYLRLVRYELKPISLNNLQAKTLSGHPVSVNTWHRDVGFHSVLLTDPDETTVRAWNIGIKKYRKGRVGWKRLCELIAAVAPRLRRADWYELDPLKAGSRKQ